MISSSFPTHILKCGKAVLAASTILMGISGDGLADSIGADVESAALATTDAPTLIALSQRYRLAQDYANARRFALRGHQVASSQNEKFGAGMEMARIHYDLDQPMRAEIWLRRASEAAPNAELRAQTIRSFQQVRAENPWRMSFQFNFAPSSNVNSGSAESVIDIDGLPFTLSADARALSGYKTVLSSAIQYRFGGFSARPALLSFSGAFSDVTLSGDAKAQAPDATGSDYDYGVLEFGYSQVLTGGDTSPAWRTDMRFGRNWYGGAALSNYARLGLTAIWQLPKNGSSTLSFSLENQKRLEANKRSARVVRVEGTRNWRLPNGNTLGLRASLRKTHSDAVEIDHRATSFGISYALAEPMLGSVSVRFDLEAVRRLYEPSTLSTEGRRDQRMRGSIMLGFDSIQYYGFAPTLTISATRTNSNVALYQREDVTAYFGIRSVF